MTKFILEYEPMSKKVDFTLSGCSPQETERIVSAVNLLLARPIAFHPIFATICDDLQAGLMLSQLWFWKDSKTAIQRQGWFYKTAKEWHEEAFLTPFQVARARKILVKKNFIQENLSGCPPKMFFKVSTNNVLNAIINRIDSSNC